MSEEYYDQKLKEFLCVALQANGYQEATDTALGDYADAIKKCAKIFLFNSHVHFIYLLCNRCQNDRLVRKKGDGKCKEV